MTGSSLCGQVSVGLNGIQRVLAGFSGSVHFSFGLHGFQWVHIGFSGFGLDWSGSVDIGFSGYVWMGFSGCDWVSVSL